MKPTVGRIVHYSEVGECYAAIVTYVCDEDNAADVDLVVFGLPGAPPDYPIAAATPLRHVDADEERGGDTWHWPEIVDA